MSQPESNRILRRMGDLLVEQGVIDTLLLNKALALQFLEYGARRIGTILCTELVIDRDRIEQALLDHYTAIVVDVCTWPDGAFVYEMPDRPAPCDMLCISKLDFILEAGIVSAELPRKQAVGEH